MSLSWSEGRIETETSSLAAASSSHRQSKIQVLTLLCVVSTEISRGISLSIAITSGDRQLDAVQVARGCKHDAPTTSGTIPLELGKIMNDSMHVGVVGHLKQ